MGALRVSVFVASALAIAIASGCGSKKPPAAGDGDGLNGGGGGLLPNADPDRTTPPGCGQKEDGSYCDCVDVPLFTDPPNIYFVLDRSGSMAEGDKWNKVRVVVAKIMRSLGPRANFGAMTFPHLGGAVCTPGGEVMSTRPGDPPSTKDGPTTSFLLGATTAPPSGGTPTAATLNVALPIVRSLQGKTFVILATDGGPNCNSNVTCSFLGCQPNIEALPGCPVTGPSCCEPPEGFRESCLDDSATLSAVSAIYNSGIPVYVIGLPGALTYNNLLDQLAAAGGTAQSATSPKYYPVNAASEAAMLAALKKIAAKITATCTFTLTQEPSDPKLVNVYLDEVVVPYDPANTWKIEGKTVTLLGAECERVKSGDVLDVRIITGCPRVEPR